MPLPPAGTDLAPECRRGPEKHGAELRLRHVAEHVPADVIEQDDDGFGD